MSSLSVDQIQNLAGDQRFGPVQMTAQSASGTAVDFTSIPSWVKKIRVTLNGLSTNGTSGFKVQIGDSGGLETTGYAGGAGNGDGTGGVTWSAGFATPAISAAQVFYGGFDLTLHDTSNTWDCQMLLGLSSAYMSGGGVKQLSGTLDRLRIVTTNGTDTFDAGTVGVVYE